MVRRHEMMRCDTTHDDRIPHDQDDDGTEQRTLKRMGFVKVSCIVVIYGGGLRVFLTDLEGEIR